MEETRDISRDDLSPNPNPVVESQSQPADADPRGYDYNHSVLAALESSEMGASKLLANTMTSRKCALVRPIKFAFDISMSEIIFRIFQSHFPSATDQVIACTSVMLGHGS